LIDFVPAMIGSTSSLKTKTEKLTARYRSNSLWEVLAHSLNCYYLAIVSRIEDACVLSRAI